MSIPLNLAVRSGTGVEIWQNEENPGAVGKPFKPFSGFKKEESKSCKALLFSDCGRFFAYGNGSEVKILDANFKDLVRLPRPKALFLKFSPKSTYLITYEIYFTTPENPEGYPNLYVYKTETGEEVFNFRMRKHSEWEPYFSLDEKLFALMFNGEIHFFECQESGVFSRVKKLGNKIGGFSISPGTSPHVAVYVQGIKGAPSMCKLFKYPNVESNPVSTKSFFQADRVEMKWNKKGTGMLILTSTEVDTTGVSYYGKQALHFLAINGNSFSVQLNADGPIHAVEWTPKSTEFIVVYGYIPSKATLFNLKCDSVFEFGTGVRNSIYFNNFGNLVLFGGFGNLRGNIEVWDIANKKEVSNSKAPDTTLLEWAPTGDIYFTATTAPRLRMHNGFKIWHYSGALLFEHMWPEKQELLELSWQKHADGKLKELVISYEKLAGIQSSQPQESDKKYVPPNVRNFESNSIDDKFRADAAPIPGLPPGYKSSKQVNQEKNSRNAQRNNINRKKPQSANATELGDRHTKPNQLNKLQERPMSSSDRTKNFPPKPKTPKSDARRNVSNDDNNVEFSKRFTEFGKNGDEQKKTVPLQLKTDLEYENDKKAKLIKKKLKDIKVLKQKLTNGETLDPNQQKKVASETELVQSLALLNAS